MFTHFTGGTWRPLLWFFVFMSLTAAVIIGGVNRGIEKYSKILMPLLVFLMIILVIRSVTLPGGKAGIDFLFRPDFSKITAKTVLDALGQAFFSLSIGMGTLITYGSYIQKRENLLATAGSVALADTLIAILAGLAIFPSVFAFHIEPGSGERLVFITLPHIFQQIPGGYYFSILFFVLLGVAALTSTISILEVIVAFFSEELKISRRSATALASLSVSVLGILCVLSSSAMADVKLFGFTVFGLMDFASANILLPLGGLFIVIFLAWFIDHNRVREELEPNRRRASLVFRLFILIIKYLAPVAIAFVFLQGIGLIKLA
jgi:neurotransmitter:Na+ symporter, NSS family